MKDLGRIIANIHFLKDDSRTSPTFNTTHKSNHVFFLENKHYCRLLIKNERMKYLRVYCI